MKHGYMGKWFLVVAVKGLTASRWRVPKIHSSSSSCKFLHEGSFEQTQASLLFYVKLSCLSLVCISLSSSVSLIWTPFAAYTETLLSDIPMNDTTTEKGNTKTCPAASAREPSRTCWSSASWISSCTGCRFQRPPFFYNEGFILLMDKILRDLTDPKLWEWWYIPYNG